jgi:L-fuconolactonase
VQPNFLRGVRLLGENHLSFDICIRPTELGDALRLTELCPDTRFILDHCGNADPKAFRRNNDGGERPMHEAAAWRRDIEALARRQNLICKISGIVARAPRGWTADDLAPIVNHCLDSFGPDRVVFGGDWPVCLLGATFRQWVEALRQIVARRPADEQRKLWSENARRLYRLDA